jgi:putative spermidine/putrescine transport system substrate-binding protein
MTLRVLGTSVTLMEEIRKRAQQDLGIKIVFSVVETLEAQRRAVLAPASYDVYDQWFHNIDYVWPAHAIQPIEIERLQYWDEINDLAKHGTLTPGAAVKSGNPVHKLYVQPDGSLSCRPSDRITMLPATHNVDGFIYRKDMLLDALKGKTESWAWLMHPHFAGRSALQADAAIGAIDAALVVQACDEMHFGDIGNLSLEEIDGLIGILIRRKKNGHFGPFWSTPADAADLMISRGVAIQSNWSPTMIQLRKANMPFKMARPKEGYRAWHGGMSLSRCVKGWVRDAAYEYMNWWLSGWPGAVVARQGFYIANPSRVRPHMTAAEWAYWYDGKPAETDLPGPDGEPLIRKGEMRDGGSYLERMSHVAVWDSVMNEHNYLVRRWTEFLNA